MSWTTWLVIVLLGLLVIFNVGLMVWAIKDYRKRMRRDKEFMAWWEKHRQ